MKYINKKFFVIMSVTILQAILLSGSPRLSAQDIADIDIVTIPLQSIYMTRYGMVVEYTTQTIYKGVFYFPSDWFRSSTGTEGKRVVGQQIYSAISLNATPILKVRYIDKKLDGVTIILPSFMEIAGIPKYTGELSLEELKTKFDAQLESDSLPFEDNL